MSAAQSATEVPSSVLDTTGTQPGWARSLLSPASPLLATQRPTPPFKDTPQLTLQPLPPRSPAWNLRPEPTSPSLPTLWPQRASFRLLRAVGHSGYAECCPVGTSTPPSVPSGWAWEAGAASSPGQHSPGRGRSAQGLDPGKQRAPPCYKRHLRLSAPRLPHRTHLQLTTTWRLTGRASPGGKAGVYGGAGRCPCLSAQLVGRHAANSDTSLPRGGRRGCLGPSAGVSTSVPPPVSCKPRGQRR